MASDNTITKTLRVMNNDLTFGVSILNERISTGRTRRSNEMPDAFKEALDTVESLKELCDGLKKELNRVKLKIQEL